MFSKLKTFTCVKVYRLFRTHMATEKKEWATYLGVKKRKPVDYEGLFVEGGVNLVDHLLEGLWLIEDGSLLHKSLCVVEELGFI